MINMIVDVGAEDILLSRTYERKRVDSPGEQQQLPIINAINASADNNSDFHRKPIRNGFYRMQLSTDMMQNLGQLFGDHDESQRKNTNFVDLPLWQWRQIYQAWQGLPVTGRHGELVVYEDFDDEFPDTLNRINEEFISQNNLNSSLQTKRIVKAKEAGRGFRKLDTASRLQLNQLYEKFPAIDRSRIDECFKDNK
ncbi:unnamed protein product [Anisakis simplex]|uniref:Peptidase A2 domain-containing protein n=1 Tax=Anisakis simplex TaxID=6269 RepID=A0A0M3JVV3_ANISI|nr:unnamed protein product [Anisakis simplex]